MNVAAALGPMMPSNVFGLWIVVDWSSMGSKLEPAKLFSWVSPKTYSVPKLYRNCC